MNKLFPIVLALLFFGCDDPENKTEPEQGRIYRIGSICYDGWQTLSTAKDACSDHKGVGRWIMSDDTHQLPE